MEKKKKIFKCQFYLTYFSNSLSRTNILELKSARMSLKKYKPPIQNKYSSPTWWQKIQESEIVFFQFIYFMELKLIFQIFGSKSDVFKFLDGSSLNFRKFCNRNTPEFTFTCFWMNSGDFGTKVVWWKKAHYYRQLVHVKPPGSAPFAIQYTLLEHFILTKVFLRILWMKIWT